MHLICVDDAVLVKWNALGVLLFVFIQLFSCYSQMNEFQLSVSICMICIISKAENIYIHASTLII